MEPRRCQRGFTLIELTMALGVAALMVTAAIGAAGQSLPRFRLRQASLDIASALQAARAKAVLERSVVTMPFDTARGMYTVYANTAPMGTTTVTDGFGKTTWFAKLPAEVTFARPDGAQVVTLRPPAAPTDEAASFDTTGLLLSTSRPGYVYVGVPARGLYRRVGVNLAGTVEIESWDGVAWKK